MPLASVSGVLAVCTLPTPIEIALLLPLIDGRWGYLTGIALAIAAGQTVGAGLIFLLGLNLEGSVRKWSHRWRVALCFVAKAVKFVWRTGYIGLFCFAIVPI